MKPLGIPIIVIFVLTILSGFSTSFCQVTEDGYGKAKWGMTKKQLKSALGVKLNKGSYLSNTSPTKKGNRGKAVIPGINYFISEKESESFKHYFKGPSTILRLNDAAMKRGYSCWVKNESRVVEYTLLDDKLFFIHVLYPEELLSGFTYKSFLLNAIETLGNPYSDDLERAGKFEDRLKSDDSRRRVDKDITWNFGNTNYTILCSGPWLRGHLEWRGTFGLYEKKKIKSDFPADYIFRGVHAVVYDQSFINDIHAKYLAEKERENASKEKIEF